MFDDRPFGRPWRCRSHRLIGVEASSHSRSWHGCWAAAQSCSKQTTCACVLGNWSSRCIWVSSTGVAESCNRKARRSAGVSRVNRHIRSACFEDAEQAHDHLQRPLCTDSHQRPEALPPTAASNAPVGWHYCSVLGRLTSGDWRLTIRHLTAHLR